MPSDACLTEPYRPFSIQVLTDLNTELGVRSSLRSRGDIDHEASETDGVVVGHPPFFLKAKDVLQAGSDKRRKGAARLQRLLGEASIVLGQVFLPQESVGLGHVRDAQ